MKRRAADGFTLLELLLAISLMAMITSSIMGGVHLGRRAWETSRASEVLDEVESAVHGVAGLIARSYSIAPDPNSLTPPPLFQGRPESCRFVALSEGGAQWAGLILTEIGGGEGREGPELVVWTKVYHPKEGFSPSREEMRKTVVLENVASFQLAFFGAQEQGRPASWSQGWNNPKSQPTLVSIKIGANRLGRVIEAAATVALRQQ